MNEDSDSTRHVIDRIPPIEAEILPCYTIRIYEPSDTSSWLVELRNSVSRREAAATAPTLWRAIEMVVGALLGMVDEED